MTAAACAGMIAPMIVGDEMMDASAPGPPPGHAASRGATDAVIDPYARRIIHVDMDAFYASVEQRDDPELRGKPLAVGGGKARGVVAAASYEAREFGVRSAMAGATARRKCPHLLFVSPRFDVYRAVSEQIHEVFRRYTNIIEPLSLDEAYLDVTEACANGVTATEIARAIKAEIKEETGLTASAGVSYCKFLAKLASDERKPDGLFVIPPHKGEAYIQQLPIGRFRGVGPKGEAKMHRLGIFTGADLRTKPLEWLEANFRSSGPYYHAIARGIDLRPVRANRIRKSVGGEATFGADLRDPVAMKEALEPIIDKVARRLDEKRKRGRTVTLKVKYEDFEIVTRRRTVDRLVHEAADIRLIVHDLLDTMVPFEKGVRLLGATVSGFPDEAEGDGDGQRAEDGQLTLF